MEELFNKPILDQMYEFRKEDFEQTIYNKNQEIKDIELKVYDIAEEFTKYLKEKIHNEDDLKKAIKMFEKFELAYSAEIDFWSCTYFKLGMVERQKLRNEFYTAKDEKEDEDTFLNYEFNDISEWIEDQKRKYTFGTKEYKELQKRYNEISEKYPNAIEVFEDLTPVVLTEEEMKALVELREIDIDMGHMEKKLCFKLGMKEVINF